MKKCWLASGRVLACSEKNAFCQCHLTLTVFVWRKVRNYWILTGCPFSPCWYWCIKVAEVCWKINMVDWWWIADKLISLKRVCRQIVLFHDLCLFFGFINLWKGSFGLKIGHFHKGYGFVYMHETTKCVLINSFYFHKWLWCMSGVLPTCYWLSIYHCIENNGTSLPGGQVEL